jgi:hypothetical protein
LSRPKYSHTGGKEWDKTSSSLRLLRAETHSFKCLGGLTKQPLEITING